MREPNESTRATGDNTAENVDAAHESDSEPGGFAISVDLSAYMGAPARCRLWVRRRARKVRWLASRVRRAAKLRGSLLLLAGDHLLPPSEPLRVLCPGDTLCVTRVEHEWQQAFSCADSDEDIPTNASQTQPSAANVQQSNPKKTMPEKTRTSTQVINPSSVVPSFKRKFTVGDTLLLLNQTIEEGTEPVRELETAHPLLAEPTKLSLEVGLEAKNAIDQESGPNVVNHDALDCVKRKALALLEQVTYEKEDTDVVDAPKKKRRRVRRRRPASKPYDIEEIQDLDDSRPNTSQNSLQVLNQQIHLDLTKEGDSETETKQKLQLVSQEPTNEDTEFDFNINGMVRSASPDSVKDLTPSSPAQPSPVWVTDFRATELPPETQVPMLVRNSALPRAPRVVRALGSDV